MPSNHAAICGRIAQLGEHLPYKQGVIGSSPIAPTIPAEHRQYAGIAQLVEQLICNQQVGGSSPSASSIRYGGVPEWLKGADCKSVGSAYIGSNPISSTKYAEVAQG